MFFELNLKATTNTIITITILTIKYINRHIMFNTEIIGKIFFLY